ncbi:hypothetical protein AZC_1634 [Azorhizobium caulinodans ORS 571]|uniref:Uncharacterized protein n=1 Tax=Azorhizobium caulinodans (strain ATCC 43989 / DSM 5975 / JCM 20966 / LMG 6465 / NBRC 14845 / NCIMB 13405 / ORS 571) TaxID=438753 RepID=A8I3N2_AZOC5|nr:hypothetical protein AZC_1634 [Azorhizobium caulinodans ORS 571]
MTIGRRARSDPPSHEEMAAAGAGEIELHHEVVIVVVAAAIEVFPAPRVHAVVPQMPHVRAVDHFVGIGEGIEGVPAGRELHGNEIARIHVQKGTLAIAAEAGAGEHRAAVARHIGAGIAGGVIARIAGLEAADAAGIIVHLVESDVLVLRAPLAHPHDGGLVVGGTDGLRDGHSLRHMNGTGARGGNEIHETGGRGGAALGRRGGSAADADGHHAAGGNPHLRDRRLRLMIEHLDQVRREVLLEGLLGELGGPGMGIARLPRKAVADAAHGHLHRRVRSQHGLEQQALRHGRDIARSDVQHVRRVEIGLPLQERADRPCQQQVIGLPEVRHRVIAGPAGGTATEIEPRPDACEGARRDHGCLHDQIQNIARRHKLLIGQRRRDTRAGVIRDPRPVVIRCRVQGREHQVHHRAGIGVEFLEPGTDERLDDAEIPALREPHRLGGGCGRERRDGRIDPARQRDACLQARGLECRTLGINAETGIGRGSSGLIEGVEQEQRHRLAVVRALHAVQPGEDLRVNGRLIVDRRRVVDRRISGFAHIDVHVSAERIGEALEIGRNRREIRGGHRPERCRLRVLIVHHIGRIVVPAAAPVALDVAGRGVRDRISVIRDGCGDRNIAKARSRHGGLEIGEGRIDPALIAGKARIARRRTIHVQLVAQQDAPQMRLNIRHAPEGGDEHLDPLVGIGGAVHQPGRPRRAISALNDRALVGAHHQFDIRGPHHIGDDLLLRPVHHRRGTKAVVIGADEAEVLGDLVQISGDGIAGPPDFPALVIDADIVAEGRVGGHEVHIRHRHLSTRAGPPPPPEGNAEPHDHPDMVPQAWLAVVKIACRTRADTPPPAASPRKRPHRSAAPIPDARRNPSRTTWLPGFARWIRERKVADTETITLTRRCHGSVSRRATCA